MYFKIQFHTILYFTYCKYNKKNKRILITYYFTLRYTEKSMKDPIWDIFVTLTSSSR